MIIKIFSFEIEQKIAELIKEKINFNIEDHYYEISVKNTPITYEENKNKCKQKIHKKQSLTWVPDRDDTTFEIYLDI